jgi:hypothetical protein
MYSFYRITILINKRPLIILFFKLSYWAVVNTVNQNKPVPCMPNVASLRPVSCMPNVASLRPVSCVPNVASVSGLFILDCTLAFL